MTKLTRFSSPFMLGFEDMDRMLERIVKSAGDGYPPYNIERIQADEGAAAFLRITLAVAGFDRDHLEVTIENNQLQITGLKNQKADMTEYLHRGIANRQFRRTFVLAEGIEIKNADLKHGLLSIDLERIEPERVVRKIKINAKDDA